MRGSGGEFILNLLGGSQDRPEGFKASNRFLWKDVIPHLSITFDLWADAIFYGYDDIEEHLFYSKFNQNFADTERFITTHLPHIRSLKAKTLNEYCLNVCKTLPVTNTINGVCFHHKHSHAMPIKNYFPCALSVMVSTTNTDLNYFRFLYIIKKLNSMLGMNIPKKELLVLIEDDMFFNKNCTFSNTTNSDFVLDAYDLFFNSQDKQLYHLADIMGLKIPPYRHTIEKYNDDNISLLKKHFNYSYGDSINDDDSKEMFLAYIDRFYNQTSR